jgi:hypothetical protein
MGRACSTHGVKTNCYRIFVGNPKEMIPLGTLNIDGKIMLKWILETWDWVVWAGLI